MGVGLKSATLLDAVASVPDLSCLGPRKLRASATGHTGYDVNGERVLMGVGEHKMKQLCEGQASVVERILQRSMLSTSPGAGFFGGPNRSQYDVFRTAREYGIATVNDAGTATQLSGRGLIPGLHDAITEKREQESRESLLLGVAGEMRATAVVGYFAKYSCEILNEEKVNVIGSGSGSGSDSHSLSPRSLINN